MFDRAMEERIFDEMTAGSAYRDRLADGIAHLWEHYLSEEWPRVRHMTETSAAAFASIDVPGESAEEQIRFITQRDSLPEDWIPTLREARRVVFIPSVHIGPFMIMLEYDGKTVYIAGHARIPEGATVQASELDRSDLLIRLDALSDETRLRVLELAADRGRITTQDVMEAFELSQSSASRHLTQLTATGLLSVDSSERTKKYQLNARRIDDVFGGLKKLLGSEIRA
jgi:DNA-binding transcriptional ArsR family regulator